MSARDTEVLTPVCGSDPPRPMGQHILIGAAAKIIGLSVARLHELDDKLRPTRGLRGERVYELARVEDFARERAKNPKGLRARRQP